VAFLFPDRAALGRIFARLIEEDVRLGAADHGVSEALYLSDPEGNGLELYADRPHSEWPAAHTDGQVAMFTEALDAPSLLAAGQDGVGPRMPADARIGHIHLSVSSLDKADAFYESILGFAVRQRDYPGARFYGRNGYHHHLAANTWQSQNAASPGALGLSRFSVTLSDPAPLVERARVAGLAMKERDGGTLLQDFDGIDVAVDRLEART
jgi:catechol 2,3-dioxygenase